MQTAIKGFKKFFTKFQKWRNLFIAAGVSNNRKRIFDKDCSALNIYHTKNRILISALFAQAQGY
ncbi:MAG: hypothetical protein IJG38_11010 [Thermoguttaceae bacterium]|nr:hypothetical protein [Thermoguttaceae bacterium]